MLGRRATHLLYLANHQAGKFQQWSGNYKYFTHVRMSFSVQKADCIEVWSPWPFWQDGCRVSWPYGPDLSRRTTLFLFLPFHGALNTCDYFIFLSEWYFSRQDKTKQKPETLWDTDFLSTFRCVGQAVFVLILFSDLCFSLNPGHFYKTTAATGTLY